MRQIVFEHMINDRDGIDDQGIIGRPHAEPHQLEKIPADNVPGGALAAPVGNLDDRRVGILRPIGLLRDGGRNAHIMPRFARHEFTLISDHLCFEILREPVRISQKEIRRDLFLSVTCKFRRADQSRDDRRQR